MVSFLGRTDIREVRCRVTDRHTDTQTDPSTVTLAVHARRGLTSPCQALCELRTSGRPRITHTNSPAHQLAVPSRRSSPRVCTSVLFMFVLCWDGMGSKYGRIRMVPLLKNYYEIGLGVWESSLVVKISSGPGHPLCIVYAS